MPDEQGFHGDMQHSINRFLQRLRLHNRTDLPAMMAQKAMQSFDLQAEAAPEAATHAVFMLVYPQNPFVSEPEVRRMNRADVGPGLRNARIQIRDSAAAPAEPDADGNYLHWPGTPEFDQVNAFYYATFTLRMFERYARREIPWAFAAPRLLVDPHFGNMANAFYDETARLIGFHTVQVDGASGEREARSTAQSADIVSHETAHAILDGLRDLYNESFGLGPRAMHESFCDLAAMLVALHDDSLIQRLLEWTDGNLRTSNFVTEIAENVTRLLQSGGSYRREDTIFLRNAFNSLVAVPFDDLRYSVSDPETMLSRQEHNYSRLFTGLIYDVLVGIYEHLKQTQPPYIALYRARDRVGQLLTLAIELGPVGEFAFDDMARALLSADQVLFAGEHHALMQTALAERGILSPDDVHAHIQALKALPAISLPTSVNDTLSAMLYLEDTLLPALNIAADASSFRPLQTYRNALGQAFFGFFQVRTIRLIGDIYGAYAGSRVDVFGGLTLMFDAENRLRSACYRPVTDEDVRQIRLTISEMIDNDAILSTTAGTNATPQRLQPLPQGLFVSADAYFQPIQPDDKLLKYPVIYDVLPDQLGGFVDYLRKWQTHKPSG